MPPLVVMILVMAAGVTLRVCLADFEGQLMNYPGHAATRMYMPVVAQTSLLALLLARAPEDPARPHN